MIGLRYS